jgi:hypothetical protein
MEELDPLARIINPHEYESPAWREPFRPKTIT